jgi:protein ImuB
MTAEERVPGHGSGGRREPVPSTAERAERTLVAWCPDWPVVAAGVPLDQPAIVVHANRVVACSPAARRDGVTTGLRRREAQGRCPSAELLAADPDRDARAYEPAVASLDVLCPRVEITRPGTCALATRGPSRYHGGDEALAEAVGAVLGGALRGAAPVQVGIADGMLAATLAARRATPDRPLVVPPGAGAAFLAPRPVATLVEAAIAEVAGLPEDRTAEIVDVLERLGLRTFGALAGVPAADVLARFGDEGAALRRLAAGLDARPLAARQPAPDLAVTLELDPPVERVDTAAFVAVGLADDLHQRLGQRGLACTRVAVVAETEHGEVLERCWRHEGTLGAAAVAERVRWQLDGWLTGSAATRPTAGISQLTLRPEEVVAARGRQLGFWGGETQLDERAARALARVAGLLGPEAVRVPERRGGRGPGEQLSLVPSMAVDLVDGRPAARDGWVTEPWPGRLPAPAPAQVHPDPPPVELVDGAGRPVGVSGRGAISAAPEVLVAAGVRSGVLAWAGPWPADERWWDPGGHRRRARIQVVTTAGSAHLLALEGGRWHLEATYD